MKPESSKRSGEAVPPVAVRYSLAEVMRHAAREYHHGELYEADQGHVSQEEIDRMMKSKGKKPAGGAGDL